MLSHPRAFGRAEGSISNPHLLAAARRGRSVAKPSLKSIIARAYPWAPSQRPSATAGNEIEVPAAKGSAQHSGDEEQIVRLAAGTGNQSSRFNASNQRNGDRGALRARSLASDNARPRSVPRPWRALCRTISNRRRCDLPASERSPSREAVLRPSRRYRSKDGTKPSIRPFAVRPRAR